jgi:hypothetical protein
LPKQRVRVKKRMIMEGFEMLRADEEDPRVVGCRLGVLNVLIISSCVYLMFTLFEGSSCCNILASWIYFLLIVNKHFAPRLEVLLALCCACEASLYFLHICYSFIGNVSINKRFTD